MLERFKRKISRTKSISTPLDFSSKHEPGLSLTPSDEQLITKLSFAPDTKTETKAPVPYNPSINTNQSERTIFNDHSRGFMSLPTEILLALKPYLRPSSEVSLRHSCSRFFYLYRMPSFYLSGAEKFDFVCMTERDQDPTQLDKLVCGRCRELHNRSAFPSAEVRKPPLERNCQQVWLCAHRSLGYQKTVKSIKAGAEAPFRAESLEPCSRCRDVIRNRSISDRPEKGTSQIDLESPKAESLIVSKIALLQRPSPAYNPRSIGGTTYQEIFGAKEVSGALQAVDFRICPHIKLGDPCILSKFCRCCLNTQKLPPGVKGPPCISAWNRETDRAQAKCQGSCFDRSCKTKFMFQARESPQPDASGRRPVWLIISVYRWLGPLLSADIDSSWRDHTVDQGDRTVMRKSWDQWSRNNRLPMPNWTICLWHPDDCSLR